MINRPWHVIVEDPLQLSPESSPWYGYRSSCTPPTIPFDLLGFFPSFNMLNRFRTDPILKTPLSIDRLKSPSTISTKSLLLCERSWIDADPVTSTLLFLGWWLEPELMVSIDCDRNIRLRLSLLLLYWLLDSLVSPVIWVKLEVSPFACRGPLVLPLRKLSRAPRCRRVIGCTVDASSTMAVPFVREVRMFPRICPLSLACGDRCQVGKDPELVCLCAAVGAKMATSGAKVDKKSVIQVRGWMSKYAAISTYVDTDPGNHSPESDSNSLKS